MTTVTVTLSKQHKDGFISLRMNLLRSVNVIFEVLIPDLEYYCV